MEDLMTDGQEPIYIFALYALFSFVCIMLAALVLYTACAKRFRLNWFEKNLLENADVTKVISESQEVLVGIYETSPQTSYATPVPKGNGEFWSSHLKRETSLSESDNSTSIENIDAGSPTSSNYQSATVTGPMPLASNEKEIILTSVNGPMRPRVSSMQTKLDHTKIDTSLYQKESPGEPEEDMGSVHVSLTYDSVSGILAVRLIEAQDLQARDFSGTADPYAKIRVLPDKANVWQTRIHKKTLNPVFDEDFVFEVQALTIDRHTLEILLYDSDAYSRHYGIGGVQIPLSNLDFTERVDVWKPLTQYSAEDPKVNLGELMVSLAYLPSAKRLTVIVIKGRNLSVVDDSRSSSDPYVKVSLLQGGKKLKKRKTGVHRSTLCPVFNEALTFDIDKETLNKCTLEFCVMHDSLLGASELLGLCRVGKTKECRPEEKSFFREMLYSKTTSAQWLPLTNPRTP